MPTCVPQTRASRERGSMKAKAVWRPHPGHDLSHRVKETKNVLIGVACFLEDVDPGRDRSLCLTHIFWLGITKFSKPVTQTLTGFDSAWVFPSDSIHLSQSPPPAWCRFEARGGQFGCCMHLLGRDLLQHQLSCFECGLILP